VAYSISKPHAVFDLFCEDVLGEAAVKIVSASLHRGSVVLATNPLASEVTAEGSKTTTDPECHIG